MSPDQTVDTDLVLLAASDAQEADRIADALIGTGTFAFIFARDAASAMSYAASTDPSLVIVALDGSEGPRLARDLRAAKPDRETRVVLVVDRREFPGARESGANALVLRPAAAVMVAVEALETLKRDERRSLQAPDRRQAFRGGRRASDINLG
jgi:PleD family two-component response regulator